MDRERHSLALAAEARGEKAANAAVMARAFILRGGIRSTEGQWVLSSRKTDAEGRWQYAANAPSALSTSEGGKGCVVGGGGLE